MFSTRQLATGAMGEHSTLWRVRPDFGLSVDDAIVLTRMPRLSSTVPGMSPPGQGLVLTLLLLCGSGIPIQAQTNQAAVSYNYSSPFLDVENPDPMEVLRRRFFKEVAASDDTVFDRFLGPSALMAWSRDENLFGYGSVERFNAAGVSLFTKIGMDSLRTAATEALPFDLWEDHWLGWLGDFVGGTIGNPAEERFQLTSISYSAVRSSWEGSKNSTIQWGLRPWRRNPYVYVFAQAGHFDSRPLLTFESRAGYTLLGASRLESRLAVQLPFSFRFAGSGTVNPARMNSNDPTAANFVITLERLIGSQLHPDSLFYIGFRSGVHGGVGGPRHENMIVLGFSKPW